MVHLASALTVCVLGLASIVSAHPGHDHKAEAAERAAFVKNSGFQLRSLAQCASKLKARSLETKNIARREATVNHLRSRRGLTTSESYSLYR